MRQAHRQHDPPAVAGLLSPDINYIKVCPGLPITPNAANR